MVLEPLSLKKIIHSLLQYNENFLMKVSLDNNSTINFVPPGFVKREEGFPERT